MEGQTEETGELEENPIVLKEREIKRLKEMIKAEQKKIKICMECKRKFATQEQLKRHEEMSEMHKENVEKIKAESQKPAEESVEMDLDNDKDEVQPPTRMIVEFNIGS